MSSHSHQPIEAFFDIAVIVIIVLMALLLVLVIVRIAMHCCMDMMIFREMRSEMSQQQKNPLIMLMDSKCFTKEWAEGANDNV